MSGKTDGLKEGSKLFLFAVAYNARTKKHPRNLPGNGLTINKTRSFFPSHTYLNGGAYCQ